MKKTLPILLGLIFSGMGLTQAQITVTSADFGTIGATLLQGSDTILPAGTTIGGTGMQTWDYSNLVLDELDTLNFLDPATTLNASLFPNSDVALENNSGLVYLDDQLTGIELDGIDGDYFNLGAVVALNINPNLTLFPFPATLNTNFTDFADIDSTLDDIYTGIFDSLRVRRVSNVDGKIDAYGSLTLPGGVVHNVLRQERREINRDTVWGKVAILGWQQVTTNFDTVYTYSWIANGEDYPVLEITAASPTGPLFGANFLIGPNVQASISSQTPATCHGDCDGDATVAGISGSGTYNYLWDAAAGSQTTAVATGLCAGTYSVTVTDGIGSTVANVSISEPGVLSASTGSTTNESAAGNDGSITLTFAGGTGPFSVAWTGPNSYAGSGTTIGSLVGGVYNATVTDNNGCTTTHTVTLTSAVGLIERSVNNQLTVFPNPARDVLIVSVEGQQLEQVRIFNLLGEVVAVPAVNGTRSELSLADLTPGNYLVQVQTEVGLATRRVVVIR